MWSKVPRLLAAVGLAGTALLTKWLVPKFGLSPEVAHVVADILVDWVVGVCLLAIGALKVQDNRKVAKLVESERVKIAAQLQPRRKVPARLQEDNRG